MVWGLARVVIFTTAFLIGTTFIGSGGTFSSAASSQTPAIPQLDEKIGTSLVVACNGGTVDVRRIGDRGAVQFDCNRTNMVVVRDHRQSSEKVPEFHPLRSGL